MDQSYMCSFFLTRITNSTFQTNYHSDYKHFYEASFSFRSRAEQLIDIFIDKITIKPFTGSVVIWKKTNCWKEYCSSMSNKIKPPSGSLCIRIRFFIKTKIDGYVTKICISDYTYCNAHINKKIRKTYTFLT